MCKLDLWVNDFLSSKVLRYKKNWLSTLSMYYFIRWFFFKKTNSEDWKIEHSGIHIDDYMIISPSRKYTRPVLDVVTWILDLQCCFTLSCPTHTKIQELTLLVRILAEIHCMRKRNAYSAAITFCMLLNCKKCVIYCTSYFYSRRNIFLLLLLLLYYKLNENCYIVTVYFVK